MSSIGEFVGIALDTSGSFAAKEGSPALSSLLKKAGYAVGTADAFAEEHPVEALAAFFGSVVAVAVLGPVFLEGAAASLAAGEIGTGIAAVIGPLGPAAVNAASSVLLDSVAQSAASFAIKQAYEQIAPVVSGFAGSLSAALSPDGNVLTLAGSSSNPTFSFSNNKINQENPDGTSTITLVSLDGSLTATAYAGPNGTGAVTQVVITHLDGTTDTTTSGPGGAYTQVHADPKTGISNVVLSDGKDTVSVTVSGLANTYNHRILSFGSNAPPYSFTNPTPDGVSIANVSSTVDPAQKNTVDFYYPDGFNAYSHPYIYQTVTKPFYPVTTDTAIFNTVAHGYDHVKVGGVGTVNISALSLLSGTYSEQIPIYASDLGQTAMTTVNLQSTVYGIAVAQISGGSIGLGNVHVGDVVKANLVISNSATGALPDALIVSSGTAASSPVTVALRDASETILAGQTATLPIMITVQRGGYFDIGSGLSLISHDTAYSDVQAPSNTNLDISGVAWSYAVPQFSVSRGVSISQSGNVWTIDLGSTPLGTSAAPFDIQISNSTTATARDTLSGTVVFQGNGFTITGATNFVDSDQLHVTNTAAIAGLQTETITLHSIDSNGGGYSGSLADQTLVIKQTVIGPPPPPAADPLFDATYYLAQYPDVKAAGVDPYQHYMTFGWKEGRNPSALFNTTYYLNQNPDVKAAGINPLTHFEQFGWKEGRDPSIVFSNSLYLSHNPDVAATGINPLLHYVVFGKNEGRAIYAAMPHQTSASEPIVNSDYIYVQHPEVAAAGLDAAAWYHSTGWKLGTNPGAYFDTNYYLAQNPDVKAAGVDPLKHYETYGWKEGRDPSLLFSTSKYITATPYAGLANFDPLTSYFGIGKNSGRPIFLTGPTETPMLSSIHRTMTSNLGRP